MKIREILWLIIIGGLLFFGTFQTCGRMNERKANKVLALQYEACLSAMSHVDTVHDTIVQYDTTWLKPKTVIIERTDTVPAKYCERYYADRYDVIQDKDTGAVYYAISVKDCETKIRFPKVTLPKQVITITKRLDTCFAKPPEYRPVNHWIIEGNLIANSFQKFPNFDLIMSYSIKDRVKLNVGGEYNAYHSEAYMKAGIGIYLK